MRAREHASNLEPRACPTRAPLDVGWTLDPTPRRSTLTRATDGSHLRHETLSDVCVVSPLSSPLPRAAFRFENFAQVTPSVVLSKLPESHPWLTSSKLVAKPDQLIKRRGKAGLIKLNATWDEAQAWIEARRNKEVQVEVVKGVLDHFLIEPFYPHKQEDEFYVCIHSLRPGDEILFYHEGGVDVGDVDAKVRQRASETRARWQVGE